MLYIHSLKPPYKRLTWLNGKSDLFFFEGDTSSFMVGFSIVMLVFREGNLDVDEFSSMTRQEAWRFTTCNLDLDIHYPVGG